MNTTVKIILVLVAGAVIVCLVAGVAGWILFRPVGTAIGHAVESDPDKVTETAASIAEYDLPAGFENSYANQFAGFDLVAYTGQDGHSHVIFFQFPEGLKFDPAIFERQLEQVTGESQNNGRNTEVVDQIPATICGQRTTLIVSEGVNSEGQAFRQVSGVFEGKGGQAMVVFERPASSWDQAEAEAFIASIH